MTCKRRGWRSLLFAGWLTALLWTVVGSGQERADSQEVPSAGPEEVAGLVEQLGADSYAERQAAEGKLLAAGTSAGEALTAALRSPDLQIRRSARRLLEEIESDDFERRLQALVADQDGTGEHDLPGWKQYRETVGADPAARKLFAEMLRAERGLMESYEVGPDTAATALAIRIRQIRGGLNVRNSGERHEPKAASLAAVIFVGSDLSIGRPAAEFSSLLGLFQRPEPSQAIKEGPSSQPLRRLIGRFILSCGEFPLAQQALQLALVFDIKEPGLRLSLRLVDSAAKLPPQQAAGAVAVLGTLGGPDYTGAVVTLLDDRRSCGLRIVNGKRHETQVRDVAAAWLVKLTGQDLDDYGLESAKKWFEMLGQHPTMCFSVAHNAHFADDKSRDASLAKLRAWLEEHPPDTVPLEPAPETPAGAQPAGGAVPQAPAVPQPAAPADALPLADYQVARRLTIARELLAQERLNEAVAILGRVLEDDGDLIFRPDRGTDLYRSVKAEAESMVADLSGPGRRSYELQFGAVARQQLEEALKSGHMSELANVESRYFYTESGWQAASLLAEYHLDRAQPRLASLYLRRLLRRPDLDDRVRAACSLRLAVCSLMAGKADEARQTLHQWREDWTAKTVTVGGSEVTVFGEDDDPCTWLREVLGTGTCRTGLRLAWGGDLSGLAPPAPDVPWLEGVHLASAGDPYVAAALKRLSDEKRDKRIGVAPTVEPLVVGGLLVRRTPTGLTAVDRKTGELRWRVPVENALAHFLRHADGERRKELADLVDAGLARRLWDDFSWGAIAANGRLVFALDDLAFDLGLDYQRTIVRADGSRQLDPSVYERANVLSAYDAETGKLAWQAGTVFGEVTPELRGGCFLGPPLALDDWLYAVVDFSDHTRLVRMDADSGAVRRQWMLETREAASPMPTGDFTQPPPSRVAPPVFADGVIVCATPSDRFVAIDAAGGRALWTYQISTVTDLGPQRLNVGVQKMLADRQADATDRWLATAAAVAGGRVLLTAYGGDDLRCVDLHSGTPLWEAPRHDGLFVGGAVRGAVVVVGRSGLRGLRLEDGRPAWDHQNVAFPPGAVPVGRGYACGDRYCLPLSSDEVAVFDVADGTLAARIPARTDTHLGNLVAVGDRIVSAGLEGLWSFDGFSARHDEAVSALDKRPDDPQAVAERARIALAAGRIDDALRQLVGTGRLGSDGELAGLYVRALVEGLRRDPGSFDEALDRFNELDAGEKPYAADWLALAECLAEAGRPKMSLSVYERLLAAGADLTKLEPVSAARAVRLDRRLATGIQQLAATGVEGPDADDFRDRADELLARVSAMAGLGPLEPPDPAEADADDALHKRLWGSKIEVSDKPAPERDAQDPLRIGQLFPVLVDRADGGRADGWALTYEMRTRSLVGLDRWGRRAFEVVLPEPNAVRGVSFHPTQAFYHAVSVGHLLLFYRGDAVIAVDLRSKPAKLAWTHSIWTDDRDHSTDFFMIQQARNMLLRMGMGMVDLGALPRSVAAARGYVCFQRGRELVGLDPATGQPVWSRDDLPVGCDLIGDAEHLVATPPGGDESLVIRPLDGRILGRRPALDTAQRIDALGSRVILADRKAQQPCVGLWDPWDEKFVWQEDLAPGAVVAAAPGEAIALVDPQGAVKVLDSATGRALVTGDVGPIERLEDAALLRFGDVFVLAVHQPDKGQNRPPFIQRTSPCQKPIDGKLFAFSAGSGELLWSRPLENQKLRIDQPSGLPVLVACNRFQKPTPTDNGGFRYGPPERRLACLDIRDGHVLHESKQEQQAADNYQMTLDPAGPALTVETVDEVLAVRFTQ